MPDNINTPAPLPEGWQEITMDGVATDTAGDNTPFVITIRMAAAPGEDQRDILCTALQIIYGQIQYLEAREAAGTGEEEPP